MMMITNIIHKPNDDNHKNNNYCKENDNYNVANNNYDNDNDVIIFMMITMISFIRKNDDNSVPQKQA